MGFPWVFDKERAVRGAIVLGLSLVYLWRVFHLGDGASRSAGLGDWIDPYFINGLLEHWHQSLRHVASPLSPPMFFPATSTLGYSHGLILYAPLYAAVRPFLHPFQAHTLTLFLAIEVGTVSLYLVFRRFLALGFVEALVLSALFLTSADLINPNTAVWSQRASVFLIPAIVLLAGDSWRKSPGRFRIALGGLAGLLATLLFTQDFYTAAFALFFVVLVGSGALVFAEPSRVRERVASAWAQDRPFLVAFAAGALAGIALFLWVHLGVYLQYGTFPADQILHSLEVRDTSAWHGVGDFVNALGAYESRRSFALVFAAGILMWVPPFQLGLRPRLFVLWVVVVSFLVLLIPVRFGGFSVWMTAFAWVPGLSIIRDPSRVIEVYELVAVLLAGALLARLRARSLHRVAILALAFLLLVTNWNSRTFTFGRPNSVFNRWVTAPIDIDASCRSFYVKGASDAYMSRSGHMHTLYAIDALFIAYDHAIPTLNGYSAWSPEGWGLANPQNPDYPERVAEWIERNRLTGVCTLDIEARTMK